MEPALKYTKIANKTARHNHWRARRNAASCVPASRIRTKRNMPVIIKACCGAVPPV